MIGSTKKSRAGSQLCFDFDRTGTGFCTLEARGMWPQDQIPSWCWKQNMASVTQVEADMCWSWSGPQRHISPPHLLFLESGRAIPAG